MPMMMDRRIISHWTEGVANLPKCVMWLSQRMRRRHFSDAGPADHLLFSLPTFRLLQHTGMKKTMGTSDRLACAFATLSID